MQEKLKAEDKDIKLNTELVEKLRSQLTLAYNIAMDIHSQDAMIRIRKAQKRRLASFMITPSKYSRLDGEIAEKMAMDGRVIAVDVASCLAPLPNRRDIDPPIYFLPKRMLDKQDDTLDDQEDQVDEAIDDADKAWKKQREDMQDKLDQVKIIIRDIKGEMIELENGKSKPAEIDTQKDDE